jgi:hypothetical protein
MGDGMASGRTLHLRQIEPGDEQALVFVFDSAAGEFQWTFAPGSMAEFVALLLGGSLRPGRGVSIPHAAISVAPQGKTGAAELCLSVGAIDLIATLDPAALDALTAGVARVRAASGKG